MKLCRYGKPGHEKPGLIDSAGKLRDLSKHIEKIDAAALGRKQLKALAQIKPDTLPLVTGNPRFGVPFTGISKYVAIGLNYSDHAAEAGMQVPTEPIIFMKATTCICRSASRSRCCCAPSTCCTISMCPSSAPRWTWCRAWAPSTGSRPPGPGPS